MKTLYLFLHVIIVKSNVHNMMRIELIILKLKWYEVFKNGYEI